jgi:hypothetical protein
MAFYSAIKNEIMLFVGIMDGIGELQVKWSKTGSKCQSSCFPSFVEARPINEMYI